MQKFYDLIKKSLTPAIWLNGIIMAVAGIFFIWKGGWFVLWPGILALVLSNFVFPFLMIPAGVFSGIMSLTRHTRPKATLAAQVSAMVYLTALLSFFVAASFYLTSDYFFPGMRIPALVWAVTAAVMPWLVFAIRDRGNLFFTGLVLMMEMGAVLVAFLGPFSFWQTFWIVAGVMAVLQALQALCEEKIFKEKAT